MADMDPPPLPLQPHKRKRIRKCKTMKCPTATSCVARESKAPRPTHHPNRSKNQKHATRPKSVSAKRCCPQQGGPHTGNPGRPVKAYELSPRGKMPLCLATQGRGPARAGWNAPRGKAEPRAASAGQGRLTPAAAASPGNRARQESGPRQSQAREYPHAEKVPTIRPIKKADRFKASNSSVGVKEPQAPARVRYGAGSRGRQKGAEAWRRGAHLHHKAQARAEGGSKRKTYAGDVCGPWDAKDPRAKIIACPRRRPGLRAAVAPSQAARWQSNQPVPAPSPCKHTGWPPAQLSRGPSAVGDHVLAHRRCTGGGQYRSRSQAVPHPMARSCSRAASRFTQQPSAMHACGRVGSTASTRPSISRRISTGDVSQRRGHQRPSVLNRWAFRHAKLSPRMAAKPSA